MGLRTPLCDLLGIDVPILSVGFGYGAGPELAAAVSNAGGCGVMGFSGIPPDHIRQRIRRARELTSRPFGGNVIIATFEDRFATDEMRARRRDQLLAALDEHISVIVLFWGDPAPWVTPAHAAGAKVILQVGSADEAARAAASGVDALIVQGVEAGGHVKAAESIWTVLPAAVRACGSVPVIASGGIGDGRAIARAMSLGAHGVSLGTRFVASSEAYVHSHYQRRLVEARGEDTVLTPDLYDVGWRDAPHRALRNSTYQRWVEAGRPASGSRPGEGEVIGTVRLPWGDVPWSRYASGMLTPAFEGDAEAAPMWAGESVDAVTSIKPAGEIVRELVREAEEALR